MKKLIILSLFVANYSLGQSITITPTNALDTEVTKIQKNGIGLDHSSADGGTRVGTYSIGGVAVIQTHSNHALGFATNNSSPKMTLATTGNFGIGTILPSQKLHVVGNGYFTGNLDSDGSLSGSSLTLGTGSTINKFIKILKTGQQIFGIVGNTCSNEYYAVTGVDSGDTVILNMESAFSTLTVANVRASGLNQVEVKFCNIANANTNLQTGINMRFTVIK